MSLGLDDTLLHSFVAIAETGSFTAAADQVHRSQSAISQQMQRLEGIAGTPLLLRAPRQVRLTPQGEVFLAYARRLLRLQEEAIAAVGSELRHQALRIGMPDDYAETLLPGLLARLSELHPEVRPHVHCAMSAQLLRLMDSGELDLAMTIRHSARTQGQTLCREELAWVAGPGFRDDPGAPLPLALFPEGCPYRARGINALFETGRDWQLVYTTQSPTGIRIAVERHGAITINASRTTPDSWRVLGPDLGLPRLPAVDLQMHRSPTAPDKAAGSFAELLAAELQPAP
jgi:DNA-binding transcriptional LysR family regulator